MDWVNAIEKAIQYIEDHLIEDITIKDVAKYVHVSEFYFQKDLLCYVDLLLVNIFVKEDYRLRVMKLQEVT